MGFSGSGSTISSATDVFFSSPATGKVLTYNASTLKWVDGSTPALASGGGVEKLYAIGNTGSSRQIDITNGNVVSATLNAATVTITLTGATAGTACSFGLYLTQDGTGNRTVTWPTGTNGVKWAGGTPPTLSTAAGAVDILVFETINGGTTWYGSLVGNNFS